MFDYSDYGLRWNGILFQNNRYLSRPAPMLIHNGLSQCLPINLGAPCSLWIQCALEISSRLTPSGFPDPSPNSFYIFLADAQQPVPSAKAPSILVGIIASH